MIELSIGRGTYDWSIDSWHVIIDDVQHRDQDIDALVASLGLTENDKQQLLACKDEVTP